jgi:hypothetical protein
MTGERHRLSSLSLYFWKELSNISGKCPNNRKSTGVYDFSILIYISVYY